MKLDPKAHRRFMDSFESSDADSCWEWTGTKNNAGYPLFSYHGRMVSATKTAYTLYYNQDIPQNWVVTHTCGKVDCMNPNHLYITSRSDMTKEQYLSGQRKLPNQQGAKNPNARLTEDDVHAIRQRKADGATHAELAKEFGVTKTTISFIHNRKLWAHVA